MKRRCYSHAALHSECEAEAKGGRLLAVFEVNSSLEGSLKHFHLSFVHSSGFTASADGPRNVPLRETDSKPRGKVRLPGGVHLEVSEKLKVFADSAAHSSF